MQKLQLVQKSVGMHTNTVQLVLIQLMLNFPLTLMLTIGQTKTAFANYAVLIVNTKATPMVYVMFAATNVLTQKPTKQ